MKSQADRCTAVYESKVFPFFTINDNSRNMFDSNLGGAVAWLHRFNFTKDNRVMLKLLNVYVDGDCELHCQDEDSLDALREWLRLLDQGEQFSVGDPRLTAWETHPHSFSIEEVR